MPYQKDRALIFYKNYYIIYISNERERKNKMIDFGACEKSEMADVLEALAYKVLQYQNPGWYEIPEDEILSILKEEGLPVISY